MDADAKVIKDELKLCTLTIDFLIDLFEQGQCEYTTISKHVAHFRQLRDEALELLHPIKE